MVVYCAIIGDIKGSRELENRTRVQARFHRTMDRVNQEFAASVEAKFLVTLGDEFQGLLRPDGSFIQVLRFIDAEMAGVPLRYGIGFGSLTTPLKEEAVGMDGPAFHRARAALGEAAKRGGPRIGVRGLDQVLEDPRLVETVLALLWLVDAVEQGWSERDRTIIRHYEATGSIAATAARLDLHRTSVSRRLKSAQYRQVQAALPALSAAFEPAPGGGTS